MVSFACLERPLLPQSYVSFDIIKYLCQVVREAMVELEIPHRWKSCGRGSPKREELFVMTRTFQVLRERARNWEGWREGASERVSERREEREERVCVHERGK